MAILVKALSVGLDMFSGYYIPGFGAVVAIAYPKTKKAAFNRQPLP